MRYEDASQISTDVTARDDTEHLAGNDFGPATGNIITGTGTVSGATGTDSGGNITAIAGAGGSDTSFDANGMLEVAGQYGTLTIDAQGNYTYVRAPGSPEGVNDTFTYTLANDAGATDTAQLVIAIGNPPILQAQGNQTVLQNGNVVTLPPGVDLSDVRVVGRDLVITLPDGSTMVIPDGAVFVPQLVVNGVEVPASNLAALLIDSEPKPAAGELTPAQQSGGGNFALPPGPLDPGVPLGDLLPPTELDYTPPEDEEIFDAIENDPPVISPSSVNVSDEGVSTVDVPIPDNAGSPDTTNLRIVNGHINVVDADGDPVTITLGEPTNALTSQGDPIDWSVSPDGHTVIGTAGGIEVIRIVINNNGDYTVTQSRPIDHPNSSIEDGVSFTVPVFATDGEDAALPGSIIVTIEDDSPVVENVSVQGGVTLDETDAGTPAGFPISATTDGAIIVNADGGFGADGAAEEDSVVYGLGLTGGVSSLASGIQTAIGNHAITLVQVSSTLIEGRYTDGGTQVAFTIEMNGDGSVTLTQNVPLEHLTDGPPGPAHDDALDLGGLVNATVTYTDFDGDSDTGTAPIGENLVFRDDGPDAGVEQEFQIPAIVLDESPTGEDEDGDFAPAGRSTVTVDLSGAFTNPVDYGADGPGSVSYALTLNGEDLGSGMYALDAGAPNGQGDEIMLVDNGDGTISGVANGTTYFTISVDGSGNVTFEQFENVWHGNTGSDDDTSFLSAAPGTILLEQTVTDSDGDTDSASIDLSDDVFQIEDDGPSVGEADINDSIDLDETTAGTPAGFPISATTANPVIVGSDVSTGTDGGTVTYGLDLAGEGDELPSGLQTAQGNHAITLVQVDADTIEGRYEDGGTQVAFTIQMNADGTLTYTQEVPLEHSDDGSSAVAHNDTNSPIDFAGLVFATITVTDTDGDSETASADIGDAIEIFDDGPNAGVNEQVGAGEVILDETRPEGTDTDDGSPVAGPPSGDASATLDFADNFFAADFGADGAGTVTYKLLLSGTDVGSGLYALEAGDTDAGDGDGYGQGDEIVLNISADGLTITGSAGGTDYFTISINPNTGQVTFTQLSPIWHPVIGDFDDQVTLTTEALNDIQVQQTITDSDGDFDTAAIGVGQGVFSIQDDGPDPYDPCPDDVLSVNDPDAQPFTGSLNLPDVGEDEPGVVTFGVETGDPVLDKEGNPVTSGDQELVYVVNGNVLEARAGDTGGALIFTITLNGDGTFTYDQIGPIGSGGETVFDNLTSSAAGNVDYRAVGENDAATEIDLILSGSGPGGADEGVNTDSDSIGVDNQSMDAGETVRIDFVTNLETAAVAAGTPMGLTYDAHVDTNSYLQTIPQVQGSQTNEVAFRVWALDTNDTQANEPDRDPTGGFANSASVAITSVTVIGFDAGEGTPVTVDISGVAVGEWTDIAYGISVQKQADGSVIFTGVQQGDQYGIGTGSNSFNSVAVQAEAEGVGPVGNESNEDSFDLGVFAIGTTSEFEPVDFEVPIILTDADGDAVECEIDIHVGEGLVVSDVTVTVNEAGLPVVGSDAASNSETQSGALTPAGGTGPYTFTLLSDPNGAYGNLVFNPDGTFTYTLDTPFDTTPDANDGTNPELAADTFDVLVEDSTGATYTATIRVNIIDDVPTANDDNASQTVEGTPITVDVLANDVEGADGVDEDNSPAVKVELVDGTLSGTGTLEYNEDGTFTYTPGAGEEGTVTFDYQITDNDGDTSVATVTIELQDDSGPQVGQPQNLIVDEDGLPGANVDNAPLQGDPAEVDSTENATASGQVVVDFGDDDVPGAPLIDSIELLDNIAYDGQLVDLDGNPVTFALNGSGQLVGTANGSTVMIISVTAAVAGPGAGQVTYTYQAQLLEPVKHADVGNNENTDILSGVQFRVTDSDGDPATGSFNVTVVDDVPSVVNAVAASGVTLDETEAGSPAGFPISDTSAAAMISATQVFGADGAAAANSVVYGLAIVGGSPEPSGLATAIGDHPITLVQIDSDTIQGQYNGANVAFTIQMNADGTVTLTQEVPLEHTTDGSTPAAHDDSLNLAGLVNATIAITDGDGDTATGSAGIGNLLVFKDDGPTIDVTAVEEEGVVLTTQDAETDGNPTNEDTDVTAIEFDSVFNLSFDAGADGLGGASPALSYDLNVTAQNSGLTSHGQVINLFEVGGVIYGTTAAVAPASAATPGVVFSLAVSGTGVVTLTQYQQVDHAVEGVTTAPFDDQFATLVNGKISLTASASITDGDGDTASDQVTIDLGGNIRFADDGPNANDDNVAQTTENAPVIIDVFANDASGADGVDLATGITLVPGSLSGSGNLVYNGDGTFTYTPAPNEEANVTFQYKITDFDGDTDTATVTIDLQPDSNPVAQNEVAFLDDDGLPAGNGPTGTNGINANLGGDPPGDSNPSEAIWSSFLNASFGGDTPGSFSFAESLETLPAVDVGQETVTYTVSPDGLTLTAVIEDSPDNSREGLTLFTVAITNATTGAYTVTLNRNVLHDTMNGTAEDDTENVVDPVVVIPFTATDSQGESTTANLSITFDDDEPDDINSEDVIVDNADGASATGSLDTLDDGDVDNEVGADQPGTVRFDPSLEDAATGLKSGGADVHYHLSSDGQTLVASTLAVYDADTFDPAAAPSHVVFTVTLNHDTTPGADDDYTVEMFGTLDNGSGFVISDFSAAPAGQNEWIGLDSDGGDINLDNNNSPDLLLTPTNAGGTVNTDNDDIANGNQWITSGEGIRVDYVVDVRRDGANDEKDAQGYLFDSHFNANGSSFKIIQTQGSGSGASVRITALNDADTGNIKTLGGSIVPIDQSSIVVTGDASYTIVNMNDGTFVITGLAAGAVVTFDTNGADYNAISITSAAGLDNPNVAGTNLFGGQDFAIGQFGFFTEQAGEDLSIELPVILTDSDGDSESTNLDITFAVPNSMALMSTESSSFRMQSQEVERTAANSNNVVLAAAIGAAGFAATGAAAETPSFDSGGDFTTNALVGKQSFTDFSGSEIGGGRFAALSAFHESGFEFGAMSLASTSHQAMMASHIGELTTSLSLGSGPNALLEATDLAEMMHAPAPAMAMDVGMPSLELIQQAASVNAQTNGAVEQILADALNGGGATPDIDSLLNALPQAGNGEIAGLNNLATQAGDHVPTWDMGHGGVFTFDVANVMQAMTLHHDAVQPVANG